MPACLCCQVQCCHGRMKPTQSKASTRRFSSLRAAFRRLRMSSTKPALPTAAMVPLRWRPLDKGPELVVALGDITTALVDAIVNPASSTLSHGVGVAAVIVKKGGGDITDDCRSWIKLHKRLEVSQVTTTRAGKLPCSYVIHVVGSSVHHGGFAQPSVEDANQLRAAIRGALCEADRFQFASIAMPGISCGSRRYPKELATMEIVGECVRYVREKASTTALKTIMFLDIDATTCHGFANALRATAASNGHESMPEQVSELPFLDQDDGCDSKMEALSLASPQLPPPTSFEHLSPDDADYRRVLAELLEATSDRVVSIRRVRASARHEEYENFKRGIAAGVKEMEDLYHGTSERWRATAIALDGFDLSIVRNGRSYGDGVYTSTKVSAALGYTEGSGSLVKLRGLVVSKSTFARHRTIVRDHIHVFPNPKALLPLMIVDYAAEDEKDREVARRQ